MSDPTPDDLVNANLDRLDGEQIRNYAERAQAEIERLQAALREIVDMPSIVIAPDGERSIKMRNEDMRRVAREALDE